jgi:hypothetical protein
MSYRIPDGCYDGNNIMWNDDCHVVNDTLLIRWKYKSHVIKSGVGTKGSHLLQLPNLLHHMRMATRTAISSATPAAGPLSLSSLTTSHGFVVVTTLHLHPSSSVVIISINIIASHPSLQGDHLPSPAIVSMFPCCCLRRLTAAPAPQAIASHSMLLKHQLVSHHGDGNTNININEATEEKGGKVSVMPFLACYISVFS